MLNSLSCSFTLIFVDHHTTRFRNVTKLSRTQLIASSSLTLIPTWPSIPIKSPQIFSATWTSCRKKLSFRSYFAIVVSPPSRGWRGGVSRKAIFKEYLQNRLSDEYQFLRPLHRSIFERESHFVRHFVTVNNIFRMANIDLWIQRPWNRVKRYVGLNTNKMSLALVGGPGG
jgi:hypothetical protein